MKAHLYQLNKDTSTIHRRVEVNTITRCVIEGNGDETPIEDYTPYILSLDELSDPFAEFLKLYQD